MKNIIKYMFIIFIIFILTMPVYAKTRPVRFHSVQSGYVTVEAIAGQDTLTHIPLSGFTSPPVIVCSPTNQLAYVSCQSLTNVDGAVWVRTLEFTGELKIGYIVQGE
jgi:hypothetical protein